jgi:UPF0176 protein
LLKKYNNMSIVVSAFYKFVTLESLHEIRALVVAFCRAHGIRGTILLANEGINGTIAGDGDSLAAAMTEIRSIPAFADLESKQSPSDRMPFRKLKVRLKKEIVTIGLEGIGPAQEAGRYVDPKDWNALISDPDVLVIDTRNHFEFKWGTFARAQDPGTDKFGDFPEYVRRELFAHKHRKIAMFCTGGIRCEKATAFMKRHGFTNVCHLKGGILRYLELIPPEQSLWQGECFVFDERIALGHGLQLHGKPT